MEVVNRISATYSKMDMIKMYMNMYLTIANESLIILHLPRVILMECQILFI